MAGPQPRDAPRDAAEASPTRGLGGLLRTEVERIDLGTHAGYALHARVERRIARLAASRNGWYVSVGLGDARAVAIDATSGPSSDLARYDLAVPRSRDAWLRTARALFVLWCAG